MGPLTGIKVVDFTLAHAGSMTAMLLADYGAEVIKIEKTKIGELARTWAPYDEKGNSGYFAYLNRGKRDLCIDCRSPEGKEIIKKLVAEADVVTENFKFGSRDRMGLGYDVLKEINPKLVYASLNGFGQTGPRKNVIGLDLHLQSMGGIIDGTGYPGKFPTRMGAALSDQISGVYMAIAIMTALEAVKKTGKGQRIDIGILDCVFSMVEGSVVAYTLNGERISRNGNNYPSISPTIPSRPRTATSPSPPALTASGPSSARPSAWSSTSPIPATPPTRPGATTTTAASGMRSRPAPAR